MCIPTWQLSQCFVLHREGGMDEVKPSMQAFMWAHCLVKSRAIDMSQPFTSSDPVSVKQYGVALPAVTTLLLNYPA